MPAKPFILDQQHEGEADGPVAQQADEIGDNGGKVVFARDGEDGDDDGDKEGPDEAGHGVEPVPQQLQRESVGVVDRDVIAQDRKHQHDEGEFGPAEGVVDGTNEAAEAVRLVGGVVRRVGGRQGGVAEAGADDGGEGGWDEEAEEGQCEDFPGGGFGGVVAVVVCGDGAPA